MDLTMAVVVVVRTGEVEIHTETGEVALCSRTEGAEAGNFVLYGKPNRPGLKSAYLNW
jgi:hypothetical protein